MPARFTDQLDALVHRPRDLLVRAMTAMLDKAESDERRLTPAEEQLFEGLKREIAHLDDTADQLRATFAEGIHMDTENQPSGSLRPLISAPSKLSDAVPADIAKQVETAGRCAFEVKTSLRVLARNIVGENLTSPPNANVVAPVSWRLIDGYVSPPSLLELLPRESVTGGSIIQNIVTYGANNTGLKAAEAPENTLKAESDLTCESSTIAFKTYAHWICCTRQVLSDAPALRQLLDSVLTRGLMAKVDAALLAALTTAGGTFTAPTGAVGIDAAAMAMAQLACMGGTGIIVLMNCMDAAAANIAKTTAGAYLGRPAELAGRIIASPIVPAGTLVAVARESCFVAERESVNVFAGLKNDDLLKNILTILAEWRGALVLSMPQFILSGPIGAVVPGSAQVQGAHARRA